MSVAGHTLEHIAYYNSELVFCGDALFSAGCGRLFEGTAEQMFNSLTKLSQLSNTTKVYCAHEYTLANLKFSLAAEPNNHAITQYIKHASALRAKNKITLPSTIELEKTINPFLRCLQSEIKQQVSVFANQAITEELDVFTQLRKWKDIF